MRSKTESIKIVLTLFCFISHRRALYMAKAGIKYESYFTALSAVYHAYYDFRLFQC